MNAEPQPPPGRGKAPAELVVRLRDGRQIRLQRGVDREQLDWMLAAGVVIDAAGERWPVAQGDVEAIETRR